MKHCQTGSHDVEKLWIAKGRDKLSACKDCHMKAQKPKVGDVFKMPVVRPSGDTSIGTFRVVDIKPSKPRKVVEDLSVPDLIKKATTTFNAWINKRDSFDKRFYCISCGELKPITHIQCGHYISSTYSYLRFNEQNCNSECISCNCMDSFHLIGYRKNLINKIGLEAVEQLEQDAKKPFKWDKQELLDIIKRYK